MFAFTKQEQRFVLFLVFSFLIGLGVSYYRKARLAKPNSEWAAAQEAMLQEFRTRSQSAANANSRDTLDASMPGKKTIPPRTSKTSLVSKIDINSASAEELSDLPRIGLVTAQKIVEYREQEGAFRTIDDLKKVKGIGPATFEKIKDSITVNASLR